MYSYDMQFTPMSAIVCGLRSTCTRQSWWWWCMVCFLDLFPIFRLKCQIYNLFQRKFHFGILFTYMYLFVYMYSSCERVPTLGHRNLCQPQPVLFHHRILWPWDISITVKHFHMLHVLPFTGAGSLIAASHKIIACSCTSITSELSANDFNGLIFSTPMCV